jgi:adenylyltransferase/sulfurtransferase
LALSTDQLERYSRQLEMRGWGAETQEKLLGSRVFVAGIGGLGCSAALSLAAAGVGELTICDGDVVERSNLNRQFLFSVDDLTRPKAPLAATRLAEINPDVTVKPVVSEIDRRTAPALIEGVDLVLDCLDNPETRMALNRACIARRTPMIYAAVSGFTGYLSFLSPPETPCLECFVGTSPPAVDPPVPSCTSAALGALEAMEALKFLTGVGETLRGRLLIMEGEVPRLDIIAVDRDPDCPACSRLG